MYLYGAMKLILSRRTCNEFQIDDMILSLFSCYPNLLCFYFPETAGRECVFVHPTRLDSNPNREASKRFSL